VLTSRHHHRKPKIAIIGVWFAPILRDPTRSAIVFPSYVAKRILPKNWIFRPRSRLAFFTVAVDRVPLVAKAKKSVDVVCDWGLAVPRVETHPHRANMR
jgi:hypothetical protein